MKDSRKADSKGISLTICTSDHSISEDTLRFSCAVQGITPVVRITGIRDCCGRANFIGPVSRPLGQVIPSLKELELGYRLVYAPQISGCVAFVVVSFVSIGTHNAHAATCSIINPKTLGNVTPGGCNMAS